MEIIVTKTYENSVIEDFVKKAKKLGLTHYASEAAKEMEFEDVFEFHEAVKRAMKLCVQVGLKIEENFMQIYKSAPGEIIYDWKLSPLAYYLVCLNGESTNSNVAQLQVQMIKHQFLNSKTIVCKN